MRMPVLKSVMDHDAKKVLDEDIDPRWHRLGEKEDELKGSYTPTQER